MRFVWVPVLLVLMALAGCVDETPDDEGDASPTATGSKAPPADYPDHRVHGEPERVDGAVQVERSDDGWRATQEVLWSNGYGDASAGSVNVSTTGGAIAVGGFDAGVYVIRSTAWAEAETEAEARARLTAMTFMLNDTLEGGTVALQHGWTAPDRTDRGVSTVVAVPQDLPHTLEAHSDDVVLIRDMHGPTVTATAGTLILTGAFDVVAASADGPTKLNLSRVGTGPGTYDVSTTGPLRAVFGPGSYDLAADGGSVTVDLPDTEPVGEQSDAHAHVRSPGFDSAAAPTTVTLQGASVIVER